MFRNEEINATNQSKFTTLEFYMANTYYNKLMEMTQEILFSVISQLNNEKSTVTYQKKEIDFISPYIVFDIMTELTK